MDEFSDKYFNNTILDLKNIINTDYYADYDKCQNIKEIEKYAKEHNLPLVNISLSKQRGLKKCKYLYNYKLIIIFSYNIIHYIMFK